MRTLYSSINSVLSRLDDPRGLEYSRTLVGNHLQEGYDKLLRSVEALFDFHFPELVVSTQTYTLPDTTVKVDRVTYDLVPLQPEYKASIRDLSHNFMTTSSEPTTFVMDADGLNVLRLVGAPQQAMTTYTVTGSYGILHRASSTEFDGETVSGTRGVLRRSASHDWASGVWGTPKRLLSSELTARVEYFRLGGQMDQYTLFEIPDHFVKVVEFWALYKCLEREGPGQDLELSAHYRQRFDAGVERLRARVNYLRKERVGKIGSSTNPTAGMPPVAQLPYPYERG